MQLRSRKRRRPRLGIFIGIVSAVGGSAIGLMLMRDIPAPSQPVEKELDAKTFLGAKQP